MDNSKVKYNIKEDGINELIDEKGSMVVMLREVAWGERQHVLELRKWSVNMDGEKPMKGCSFLTDKGPDKLAEVLIKNGFGDTKTILGYLQGRKDYDDYKKLIKENSKLLKETITKDNKYKELICDME